MAGFGLSKSGLTSGPSAQSVSLDSFIGFADTLTRRVQTQVNGTACIERDTVSASGTVYNVWYYNQGSNIATGTAAISREISNDYRITANAALGGGGDAYVLPWNPDTMCLTELRSNKRLFVTATLNGCAIVIAGGRCNPVVGHLNISVNSSGRNGAYEAIARALEARGLDADNRILLTPGAGYTGGNCGVYGIQGGDQRWTFYCNDHGASGATTRRIWPA